MYGKCQNQLNYLLNDYSGRVLFHDLENKGNKI